MSANPTRVWVSLDGPREINDAQRGAGVYDRATRGIDAIDRLKHETGHPYPELGVTFVVTPDNHHTIQEFFLELDLSRLGAVSIELQSYVTAEQHRHYARVAHEKFGVTTTPSAAAYVRDPAVFANVDADAVARQMRRVRDECRQRGIRFFSQPHTLESETIAAYLSADWTAMADHHQRCAVPWMYAEISARGDVTTCHSFYDITVGNIYDRSLIDIWHGERAAEVRSHLRRELFSICTACSEVLRDIGASHRPDNRKAEERLMTHVKSTPVVDRVAFEKLRRIAPGALAARRARQVVRPLPDEVSFKLTNRCNLRCHHCYQWGDDGHHHTLEAEERNRDLDISVVAKVLDATRQRGANVFLWGGEPLFYSHWDDLVELLAEHRRWTSVCTNGVYIEKRLDSLLTISDRLEMFIALDGFETEHDALRGALSWRRTMKGLRRLVHERQAGNYRGEVTVNCVFQDSMVGKLFDFVTFMQDEGVDAVYLSYPWHISPRDRRADG